MAKVVISVPGERIIDEITALVPQITVPSTAQPPNIGTLRLSQSTPTELIPGPPGPPGPRGSQWTTGTGAPSATNAAIGDMYLDNASGQVWTWDGTAWVNTGTDITGPQGSPDTAAQVLAKLVTVDGSGSNLDADLLDGHDTAYFATASALALNADTATTVTSVTGTAPVVSSGGLTPAISMPAATTSVNGYLTFANWNTFNAKVPEAPNDGTQYVRMNQAWSPVSVPPGTVISDTPPGSPAVGQMWFQSSTGNTFIWYGPPADPDSSQWVQINVVGANTSTNLFGFTRPTTDGSFLWNAKSDNTGANIATLTNAGALTIGQSAAAQTNAVLRARVVGGA